MKTFLQFLKEGLDKELKQITRNWQDKGWRVEKQKSSHVRFYPPHGIGFVTTSGTPSDHRGLKNLESMLRRYHEPEGARQEVIRSTGRDPLAKGKY